VLMHGGTLNRVTGSKLPVAFRDPEWQANTFAGALLMPEPMVRSARSVQEVIVEFGVTDRAARTRLRISSLHSQKHNDAWHYCSALEARASACTATPAAGESAAVRKAAAPVVGCWHRAHRNGWGGCGIGCVSPCAGRRAERASGL
jgi:hypothetical protein